MPKQLTPGSLVRFFQGGETLTGESALVPETGPFTVRHLPPGAYVARDDCGGEVDFTVSPLEEITTVWDPPRGREQTAGAAPGSSAVIPLDMTKDDEPYDPLRTPPFPNVGVSGILASDAGEGATEPEKHPPLPRRDAPDEPVSPDSHVAGGAGAGLVLEGVPVEDNFGNPVLEPQDEAAEVVSEEPPASEVQSTPIGELLDGDVTPEERPDEKEEDAELREGNPITHEGAQEPAAGAPVEGSPETA